MDIDKYIAGKAAGISKVQLHGDTTLLLTVPGGFDPDTGAPLPAKEQGYQLADLDAMRESAVKGVTDAEDALAKAQARVAAFDVLLNDAIATLPAQEVVP